MESTDKWLQWGNPWEIARPEGAVNVGFGGHTEPYQDEKGHYRVRWIPATLSKPFPMTRRFWDIERTPSTRCVCGNRKR